MIDAFIYLTGSYEDDVVDRLKTLRAEHQCTVLIDVGANVGVHAMNLARVAEVAEVHAFEPDPRNRAQLMANLWLNGLLDRVRVSPVALTDRSGTARFWLAGEDRRDSGPQHNTMLSGLSDRGFDGGTWVDAEAAQLDELVDIRGRRVLIKLDVEGHELEALKGMRRVLEANHCVIAVEVWSTAVDRGLAIDALLGSLGYEETAGRIGENRFYSPSGAPRVAAAVEQASAVVKG